MSITRSRESPAEAAARAAAAATRAAVAVVGRAQPQSPSSEAAAAAAAALAGTRQRPAAAAPPRSRAAAASKTAETAHNGANAPDVCTAAGQAAANGSVGTAAAALAPPPGTVQAAVPGTFCAELWDLVAGPGGLFGSILAHPFLQQLVDGTLKESCFRFYVVQDALYLREYARALALVASKAPRPDWTALFCRCAQQTYDAEGSMHEDFMRHFGTTVAAETAAAPRCPNNLLYTSWLIATVHERAFYEGLAAVLPCFVVYLEVGKALKQLGSPHPLYQQWLDKYGGEEFEGIVMQVVGMVNAVAEELGPAQLGRMRSLFQQGCRMEWLFWDGAYKRQQWPI